MVAKGNVIEVWDASPEGLIEVARTEVWGIVVGLEWVVKPVRKAEPWKGKQSSLTVSFMLRIDAHISSS